MTLESGGQHLIDIRCKAALHAYHSDLKERIHALRQQYFTNIPKSLQPHVLMPMTVPIQGDYAIEESPLKLAIRYRDVALVNDLLRCGADIHQRSGEENTTPVHELNDILTDDFSRHHIYDIRISLITKAMQSQAFLMESLPFLTIGMIIGPLVSALFIVTGQLHNLQYYTATLVGIARVLEHNAAILGGSFRTAYFAYGTYFNLVQPNQDQDAAPSIYKPSTPHKRRDHFIYDSTRLALYIFAYMALACHNIPVYGAFFTLAIAACSVRQVIKLLQVLNEPKLLPSDLNQIEEDIYAETHSETRQQLIDDIAVELFAKYYNQLSKIDKHVIHFFEKGAYALLVGSWFISPMNVASLAVLSLSALAVYTAQAILISLVNTHYFNRFNEHIQQLRELNPSEDMSDSMLLQSDAYFHDTHASHDSISTTISWCFSGMVSHVSMFIMGYVHKEGASQTFKDAMRVINDSVDRIFLDLFSRKPSPKAAVSEAEQEDDSAIPTCI